MSTEIEHLRWQLYNAERDRDEARERLAEVERECAATAEEATRQRDRAKRAELDLERVTLALAEVERERGDLRVQRDALQRHYDEAGPEHNLLALLDHYIDELNDEERECEAIRVERDEARARLADVERERDEARKTAPNGAVPVRDPGETLVRSSDLAAALREVEQLREERDEARDIAARNARDCAHLRQSAITLTNERDEARETARVLAEVVDDDCMDRGFGRYSIWLLATKDRALAYPRGGG